MKIEHVESMDKNNEFWIKYFRKGRIFARRHCKFSTFEDNVLTVIAKSNCRNHKVVMVRLSFNLEDIIFIGDEITGQIIYADKKWVQLDV